MLNTVIREMPNKVTVSHLSSQPEQRLSSERERGKSSEGREAPDTAERDEEWRSLWAAGRQVFKRLTMELLCGPGIPPLGTLEEKLGMSVHTETGSQTSGTVIPHSPRAETPIISSVGNNMWPRQSGRVLDNRREQLLLTQQHGRLQMPIKVKSLWRQAGCRGWG